MKTIFVSAILLTIAANPAMAESFTRDGYTYTYEVKERHNYKIISGVSSDTGEAFRLVVKGTRVSGQFGSKLVVFRLGSEVAATTGGSSVIVAAK